MTFFRYVVIQLLAYVIDIGIFLIILNTGFFGAVIANVLSKISAGFFAFVAHRKFTFYSDEYEGRLHQAGRYFILLLLNIPLSSVILVLILTLIKDVIIAKIVTDVLGVLMTFWLSKSFVFVKKQKQVSTSADLKDLNI